MTKEQIRALQEMAKMDQTELAKAVGVHRLSLRAWLTGKSVPEAKNARKLWALARKLKVTERLEAIAKSPALDRDAIVDEVLARVKRGLGAA